MHTDRRGVLPVLHQPLSWASDVQKICGVTRATDLAYEWLRHDLYAIGWCESVL